MSNLNTGPKFSGSLENLKIFSGHASFVAWFPAWDR